MKLTKVRQVECQVEVLNSLVGNAVSGEGCEAGVILNEMSHSSSEPTGGSCVMRTDERP